MPATETPRLTWAQVAAWRAKRHHLDKRAPASKALDVVSRLGGLHAQVMSSAELSLWNRVNGVTRETVPGALWEKRTLVKAWAMRGTLHLLPSSEYPLWQAGVGTNYRHYLRPAWLKWMGVTEPQLVAFIDAIGEALDGRTLTREQLAAEVTTRTGSKELGELVLGSWGSALKPAAFRGRLCFGPGEGQKVRFTNPSSWLPEAAAFDGDPLAEIARRFLSAYAPATPADFGRWWAGGDGGKAGKLLAGLDDAVEVDVEGTRAWALSGDVKAMAEAKGTGSIRLLPAFDPYLIGATVHAESLMPGPFKARVYRAQGWLSPVVLVDGRIEGVWSSEVKGRTVHVKVEPFVSLPARRKPNLRAEAEKLAGFLGGRLELTLV
jgi:hypothetical protein